MLTHCTRSFYFLEVVLRLLMPCMICIFTSAMSQHWKIQLSVLPSSLSGFSTSATPMHSLVSLQWSRPSDQWMLHPKTSLSMKPWLDFVVILVPDSMHQKTTVKWGIKVFNMADSLNGYLLDTLAYNTSCWHTWGSPEFESLPQPGWVVSCTLCGITSIATITYAQISTIQAYLWHNRWLLITPPSLALSWKIAFSRHDQSRIVLTQAGVEVTVGHSMERQRKG